MEEGRRVYPEFRLEAIGNIVPSKYVKNSQEFEPFIIRNPDTEILEISKNTPEEFNKEVIDILEDVAKDMSITFSKENDSNIQMSNIYNVFVKYKELVPERIKKELISLHLPDTYAMLDILKTMLNDKIENTVLGNVTDVLIVEGVTEQPNYKDPVIMKTLSRPRIVNNSICLNLFYNIPIIKGRNGKIRYISFKVNLK